MSLETFRDGPFRWIKEDDYNILLIGEDPDSVNDNVDVEVRFNDGRRYCATLFTLRNLQSLLETYESTGECGGGSYFWASDMVIVRRLTPEAIAEAVAALIAEGELNRAFARYAHGSDKETT